MVLRLSCRCEIWQLVCSYLLWAGKQLCYFEVEAVMMMCVWIHVQAQSLMQLPRLARALARERELLSAVDGGAKEEPSLESP